MSSQNLVFCSYTVKHTVLFIYIIYGALAAQGGICKCADCRLYITYDQFGRHLYVFTVRLTVKIHWHKRSFQCSRLVSYYSFLSSCYCEKRQKPIWKEMQNINIQFKAMFLKMLPTIGCPSQQCILLLYN